MASAAASLSAVMGDPALPQRAGIGVARRDRELDFQGRVLRRQHHLEMRSPRKRDVLGAVFGLPEAMVKIVPNGGAKDRAALGNQLGYLARQGDVLGTVVFLGIPDVRDDGVVRQRLES